MMMLRGLILVLCASSFTHAGDWPQFMGPTRNHVSSETQWLAPKDDSKVIWRAKVGIGYSGITVADGMAYTLGHQNGKETLWCLDAVTGKVIWQHTYAAELIPTFHAGGPNAAPTVEEGHVYSLSKDGQLFSCDAKTGKVAWTANLFEATGLAKMTRWGFASAPWIDGDTILLHSNGPIAFNKDTGKMLWKGTVSGKPGYSSAAVFEYKSKRYIAAMTGDALNIYDRQNGQRIAQHPFAIEYDMHVVTPMITTEADGKIGIFIACANKGGRSEKLSFDGTTLTSLWVNENLRNFMNNSVLVGDHLYGFDGKHKTRLTKFTCIRYSDGAAQWVVPNLGCGSLITAAGKLIVLTEDGRVMVGAASPVGFEPEVTHAVLEGTCWTPPTLAQGRLYIRNEDGDVACMDWRP